MNLRNLLDPERSAPWALTLLRVALGVVMMAHGWLKLQDPMAFTELLATKGMPMPEVLTWLAIGAEFGGGALVALGLLTPIGALAIAINLGVAIARFHVGNGLFTENGGWELPGFLLVAAVYFMIRGGGRFSLDWAFSRRIIEASDANRRIRPSRRPLPA